MRSSGVANCCVYSGFLMEPGLLWSRYNYMFKINMLTEFTESFWKSGGSGFVDGAAICC